MCIFKKICGTQERVRSACSFISLLFGNVENDLVQTSPPKCVCFLFDMTICCSAKQDGRYLDICSEDAVRTELNCGGGGYKLGGGWSGVPTLVPALTLATWSPS